MTINSISFGRGIYGSRIEEDTYFANIERQSKKSNYPISGGKVEKYAWEREHGWHDDSYQGESNYSSNRGSSRYLISSSRYINPDTGRPYRCSDN